MTKNISRVNTMTNPFRVEKRRQDLAMSDRKGDFQKAYEGEFPEIKNLNTVKMWDSILDRDSNNQDPMTKDRINKTANLVRNNAKELLDVGIGDGWVERKIIKNNRNIHITGLDIAGKNLKKLSKIFNNFTPVRKSLEKLKAKDLNIKYDYILALEVFEHIAARKILKIQKELRSLLKEEGRLVVSVPINEDLEEKIIKGENFSQHVRRYTREIIRYELECSGFEIIKEINLYAFSKNYNIKTLISRIFNIRKPSISIILCKLK